MPLQVKLGSEPAKYLSKLDAPTKNRISERLIKISKDPSDIHLWYPLKASDRRCTRVGKYRILFQIDGELLLVYDIGSRGQIYRKA